MNRTEWSAALWVATMVALGVVTIVLALGQPVGPFTPYRP